MQIYRSVCTLLSVYNNCFKQHFLIFNKLCLEKQCITFTIPCIFCSWLVCNVSVQCSLYYRCEQYLKLLGLLRSILVFLKMICQSHSGWKKIAKKNTDNDAVFESGSHESTWKFGLVLTLHIVWPIKQYIKNKIKYNSIIAIYLFCVLTK